MGPYEPVESPDESTVFPYHDLTPPAIRDVVAARQVVERHLPRTPLVRSESLSDALDADVLLKREDTLPTGAFKVRGGVSLVAGLDEEFRDRGLVAASTGNHGQSLAWAGRRFDVPVTIGVPESANPDKVANMRRLGADVVERGGDFDEAREHVEDLAATDGYRYVHSANEPALVAGVGTAGLEVVEDCPGVDVVFTPVGGGSSAAGYCLTVGALTDADVVGVQAAGAPATYHAWADGTLDSRDAMDTFAEGIATRVPFALTTEVLRSHLEEFTLVTDDQIGDAVARLYEDERILIEGAPGAAIAAALAAGDELAGQTVVLPITGRNVAPEQLDEILADGVGGQ